jgi:acyl-CoA reductase-like NAD-dependent aldehyde dehydrogenase
MAHEPKVDVREPVAWRLAHFIDGRFVAGEGADLAPENPATGEVLASLLQVSNQQLDAAVAAARRAFKAASCGMAHCVVPS